MNSIKFRTSCLNSSRVPSLIMQKSLFSSSQLSDSWPVRWQPSLMILITTPPAFWMASTSFGNRTSQMAMSFFSRTLSIQKFGLRVLMASVPITSKTLRPVTPGKYFGVFGFSKCVVVACYKFTDLFEVVGETYFSESEFFRHGCGFILSTAYWAAETNYSLLHSIKKLMCACPMTSIESRINLHSRSFVKKKFSEMRAEQLV